MVFGHVPSGVAALAACVDGTDQVMVASSFTAGVSMVPPLVSFAAQNSSTTWPQLRRAVRIGVSVLAAEQEVLCRRLGSKDRSRRWQGVELVRAPNGSLLIAGAVLHLDCSVEAEHPAGDHGIVLLRIHAHGVGADTEPLLFHRSRFRSVTR